MCQVSNVYIIRNQIFAIATCCLELFVGLTEKCKSFIARSIKVTVYGLFVSGFTHLSATVVAISLNVDSNWACRSFSDTCNSPFAKIYKIRKMKKVKINLLVIK